MPGWMREGINPSPWSLDLLGRYVINLVDIHI